MDMSSEMSGANENDSILPEVAELSEFHPDQLSNLVDIQEELEKLEASEIEKESSISMVDDVNVVDHEVTIVADTPSEESILPEFKEVNTDTVCLVDKKSSEDNFNSMIEESLGLTEIISNNTSVIREMDPLADDNTNSNLDVQVQQDIPSISKFQLKLIKPTPDSMKNHTTFVSLSQAPKSTMAKVIFTPSNQACRSEGQMIIGEPGNQGIRLLSHNKTLVSTAGAAKAITLAQAKEMGKIQILTNSNMGAFKKITKPNKTLTMVKSPVKILPLPTTSQVQVITSTHSTNTISSIGHKILIRQPGTIKSNTILKGTATNREGQVLQLPVSQDNKNNQIHPIQLPGKQIQYVRLVNTLPAKNVSLLSNIESKEGTEKHDSIKPGTFQTLARPVQVALTSAISSSPQIKMMNITSNQVTSSPSLQVNMTNNLEKVLVSPGLNTLTSKPEVKSSNTKVVMVAADYIKQYRPLSPSTKQPPLPIVSTTMPAATTTAPISTAPLLNKAKENSQTQPTATTPQIPQKSKPPSDSNGIKPRKPCNCTKSQCLKLYCDCFANGEFCFQCNCNCCFNNLDHEEERQRAIKACLERNPNAFRPKIGKGYVGDERRHNKGCHCKRSGCLKNYCECYEAKIPCSNNCKCVGCRNLEEIKVAHNKGTLDGPKKLQPIAIKSKLPYDLQQSVYKTHYLLTNQGNKQPSNLMTHEVVEATCQCLLAQVEGNQQLTDEVEKFIIEEFGRCLIEIIECTTRTSVNNIS